jgi:hypothetical protein
MFVYLLVAKDGKSFKIGKANDVWARMASIGGRASYDLTLSKVCSHRTAKRAGRVEKSLHRLFEAWRLPHGDRRQEGDTEFFSMECHGKVLNLVGASPDLFGELGDLPKPPRVATNEQVVLSREDLKARQTARAAREREEKLAKALSDISGWIEERKRQSAFFGFLPPDQLILVEDSELPDSILSAMQTPLGIPGFYDGFIGVGSRCGGADGFRINILKIPMIYINPEEQELPAPDWPRIQPDPRVRQLLTAIPGFDTADGFPGAREIIARFERLYPAEQYPGADFLTLEKTFHDWIVKSRPPLII